MYNLWMNQTRVAPVKDSKYARKSLAYFELCQRRLRADYLGRYSYLETIESSWKN